MSKPLGYDPPGFISFITKRAFILHFLTLNLSTFFFFLLFCEATNLYMKSFKMIDIYFFGGEANIL